MDDDQLVFKVSDAIAVINQSLEYAYSTLVVEGEVASFKVNQNRFVFFDIKDETGTLNCFMTVYQLRIPIEDGMTVRVVATPKLTQWGRFSLTVRTVQPVGAGALKRSFDLLKAKLEQEGLFAPERKRPLPQLPGRIGVISSTQAAGYADFIKILNDRWGGLEIIVAHTQVQGADAPAQIVRALEHLNQLEALPEVIVIVRGGGSADDLSAFNDEPLVRAIAGSRVPVLTGIGHEIDVSLCDLAADCRAATPSNAAQLLVPDSREILADVNRIERRLLDLIGVRIERLRQHCEAAAQDLRQAVRHVLRDTQRRFDQAHAVLTQLDPRQALKRGYAIVRHDMRIVRGGEQLAPGDVLTIELSDTIIESGVKNVRQKS